MIPMYKLLFSQHHFSHKKIKNILKNIRNSNYKNLKKVLYR